MPTTRTSVLEKRMLKQRKIHLIFLSLCLTFLFIIALQVAQPGLSIITRHVLPHHRQKAKNQQLTLQSPLNQATNHNSDINIYKQSSKAISSLNDERLSLPNDYLLTELDDKFCRERFGVEYLRRLSSTMTEYCTERSGSSLKCFHSKTKLDGRVDVFCITGPVLVKEHYGIKFELDCKLKEDLDSSAPKFRSFPAYWYNTGPRTIFRKHFEINQSGESKALPASETPTYSILVQREGDGHIWHCLMEIFSMYMSMDVLQMTPDPQTGAVMYNADDAAANTQIIVLDDHPDGPFLELWAMFSKRPIVRAKDIKQDGSLRLDNVIIPLAGGSNPQWQADWDVLPCTHPELLETFSRRILHHYGFNDALYADDPQSTSVTTNHESDDHLSSVSERLVITFINRTSSRKLVDQSIHLSNFRSAISSLSDKIEIREVDFADFTMREQLRLVRETDVLVGVHGAGLTHAMFLKPGAAVAEIIPPDLNHKGFRNLALMRSLPYFSAHGKRLPEKTVYDSEAWHWNDVRLERETFVELLDAAIKSVFNRRKVNIEIG